MTDAAYEEHKKRATTPSIAKPGATDTLRCSGCNKPMKPNSKCCPTCATNPTTTNDDTTSVATEKHENFP
jgi:predicted amidophosphoribosyltransferase